MAVGEFTLHVERRCCRADALRHRCAYCRGVITEGQPYVSLCQIVYGLFNYKVCHADACS